MVTEMTGFGKGLFCEKIIPFRIVTMTQWNAKFLVLVFREDWEEFIIPPLFIRCKSNKSKLKTLYLVTAKVTNNY